jgi:type I restriction enzyme S subunit
MPPLEEQQAICDFLEDRVRAIGLIIEQQQLFIGRLQEYRQALITAAVTGKIDVRRDQRERTNIQDVC